MGMHGTTWFSARHLTILLSSVHLSKTRLKKLALKVCSECKRNLGGVLKACDPAQACMCEGAPVWTQYIAISQFMMIPGSVNMY